MARLNTAVVKRYAKALWLLSEGDMKQAKLWLEQMQCLANAYTESEDFLTLVQTPVISSESKWSVISELAVQLKANKFLTLFWKRLCFSGRMNCLPEITKAYQAILMNEEGVVPVQVESAFELSDEEMKTVAHIVEQKIGKSPVMSVETEEELMAGIRVHVEGKTWDSTLQSNLEKLERELLAGDALN